MTKPQRIQLKRMKGFNLQRESKKLNGLPAVNCARPSKWGNPHRAEGGVDKKQAVCLFQIYLEDSRKGREIAGQAKTELCGKNLGCFCKLDELCHCDALLEIAKEQPCKTG